MQLELFKHAALVEVLLLQTFHQLLLAAERLVLFSKGLLRELDPLAVFVAPVGEGLKHHHSDVRGDLQVVVALTNKVFIDLLVGVFDRQHVVVIVHSLSAWPQTFHVFELGAVDHFCLHPLREKSDEVVVLLTTIVQLFKQHLEPPIVLRGPE